jgi:hypothetical protein
MAFHHPQDLSPVSTGQLFFPIFISPTASSAKACDSPSFFVTQYRGLLAEYFGRIGVPI